MYLEYYGLREAPFSITPDPRYVFLSERHRDALAHLLYGIGKGGSGGFVQLTGEVGTGKTTLSRLLLEQLPENTRVALLLNPRLSPIELIETACEELKVDIEGKRGSLKALTDALNTYLLDAYAQGLRVVLIVDEAQNLSMDALEQIRLLTNLETPTQKLLQIILLGQPELRTMLERPELRQLAQRITARYHLTPLDAAETEAYVKHRMAVAGCTRPPFSRLGLRALYQRSGGIPRLINVVADRALMAGYAREQQSIGERLVDRSADETLPGHARYWLRRFSRVALATAAVVTIAALAWMLDRRGDDEPAAVVPAAAVAPTPTTPDPGIAALAAHIASPAESELHATTQLLARWQVGSNEASVRDATRCPATIAPGLNCLRGRATLEQVLRFDRPLVLVLTDGGAQAHALLQGAGRTRVRLDLAGESIELPRAELGRYWPGDFLAIWRVPTNMGGRLRRGDAGPAVAWVKDRLHRLDRGADGEAGPAFFDEALEERVRKLQLAYGIQADGIIGPETLFALSALDEAGPHLIRNIE
ncbi:MAG: AAA family ATPase [Luteimonas sp.]|uniref:ExeA family protein n=1 Tax=Dokdonella sp. TaxID=2291710 RepID=UPI0025C2123F|nr:ExeA family protein [Dokdonella sp.]MBX3691284.1 AAA family ATPase [Dokdonella sp.]MCW5580495.1 AAA family ATPase [Luteimonas sp.]